MTFTLHRLLHKPFACLIGMAVLGCGSSHAADITLHASAIDAGLKKEIFRTGGRYLLSGDLDSCSYAYLEKPATSLRGGRIYLRMHFSAQVGVAGASGCVGHVEAFWVSVSGRPFLRGEVVGISEFRLEEGSDVVGPMLESFLAANLPRVINVNLRQELTRILTSSSPPYKVSLPRLDLRGLSAERDALRLEFDFSLEAR